MTDASFMQASGPSDAGCVVLKGTYYLKMRMLEHSVRKLMEFAVASSIISAQPRHPSACNPSHLRVWYRFIDAIYDPFDLTTARTYLRLHLLSFVPRKTFVGLQS